MIIFSAVVALNPCASNPIATFIAESLKPLRDFFLVLFFFALGAGFPLHELSDVAVPALVLAAVMLVVKPAGFRWLLLRAGERPALGREIGVRLGQLSEFALLVSFVAVESAALSDRGGYLIQAATLLSFLASTTYISMQYPTPSSANALLRQD